MAEGQQLRAVGDRIEHLLDLLQATADPDSWARAQELLALVTDMYGAGLARIVELAGAEPDRPASALMSTLAADDLVASLLVLHGLHPDDLAARVEQALEGVRPYLATHGGNVELLGVDDALGAVLIRLLGSCDGCASSSITLKLAVERAIAEAAPEVARIVVEGAGGEGAGGEGAGGAVSPFAPASAVSAPAVATPIRLSRKPAPAHSGSAS
jgi:Fe-S cluster biogenesis protein NfuA